MIQSIIGTSFTGGGYNPPPVTFVTIGSQIWSNFNLNVDTYKNGDPIPQVQDPIEWKDLTTGAWCWYNNSTENGIIYGKLYNWYAVNDPRGLAPTGYHIPTEAEWITLINTAGGPSVAKTTLRQIGNTTWGSGGTDLFNFTALPGGRRKSNFFNTQSVFEDKQNYGYWWTSDSDFQFLNAARSITISPNDNVFITSYNMFQGQSVRLVKD